MTQPSLPLSGKVALITGGSRGIGAATVRRLSADGAKIAFTYSKSAEVAEKLAKELGDHVKAYKADAADLNNTKKLVADIVEDFGGIDILVNNAGILSGDGMIGEIDPEGYQQVMRINVDAVFAITNDVVKIMKSGSRIVNISSVLGERAGFGGISSYVASKFAVAGQTRAWAQDLGAKNILVNAILPGPTATDMNPDTGEFAEAMLPKIPLGRYGRPEEIANAVAFLVGPQATFITGSTLAVDGGVNA